MKLIDENQTDVVRLVLAIAIAALGRNWPRRDLVNDARVGVVVM